MVSWKQSLRDGAVAGSVASILSAAVLLTHRKPAAPVNAISHWVWGDPALARDKPSWRHTAVGYLIHHGASLMWSTLHARVWGKPRSAPEALAKASATAAAAAFVDYNLTPHRFTPGFEHRLSKGQLTAVYVMFAIGLALGSRRFRR